MAGRIYYPQWVVTEGANRATFVFSRRSFSHASGAPLSITCSGPVGLVFEFADDRLRREGTVQDWVSALDSRVRWIVAALRRVLDATRNEIRVLLFRVQHPL
ncbi:MAG: hypothetical protein B7Z29_01515 [Hyphomicrobium sp. 12-62-95]|nr:MAG: hypothetical protein B7Z29_01515 [Hyphomicrobium sp. 12-62-95]